MNLAAGRTGTPCVPEERRFSVSPLLLLSFPACGLLSGPWVIPMEPTSHPTSDLLALQREVGWHHHQRSPTTIACIKYLPTISKSNEFAAVRQRPTAERQAAVVPNAGTSTAGPGVASPCVVPPWCHGWVLQMSLCTLEDVRPCGCQPSRTPAAAAASGGMSFAASHTEAGRTLWSGSFGAGETHKRERGPNRRRKLKLG